MRGRVLCVVAGTIAFFFSTVAIAHHGAASIYEHEDGDDDQGDGHRIRLDQPARRDRDLAERRHDDRAAARARLSAEHPEQGVDESNGQAGDAVTVTFHPGLRAPRSAWS